MGPHGACDDERVNVSIQPCGNETFVDTLLDTQVTYSVIPKHFDLSYIV